MISGGPRVNFMHTSSLILVAPEMIPGGPRVNFMHTSSFILVAPEIISEDPRVNFMHTSSFILVMNCNLKVNKESCYCFLIKAPHKRDKNGFRKIWLIKSIMVQSSILAADRNLKIYPRNKVYRNTFYHKASGCTILQ